ncbi:hypothetical protein ACFV3E_05920 [Streptomyces sp. NPDC059718]
MPLNQNISTAPGTRPDPKHETVYDPARGGHYPQQQGQPAQQQDAQQQGQKAS